MTSDSFIERLRAEERRSMRWLLLALTVVAIAGGAFGWWVSSLPPRPILVQFDKSFRVEVQVAPEKRP